MPRLLLLTALASSLASLSAQTAIVLPNGYAAVEGSSSSVHPWADANWSSHLMTVYDAADLVAQGVTGPVLITELRFRPDATTSGSWLARTSPDVKIDLSTCPVDYTAITTTFAANRGVDVRRVFEGAVTIPAGSIGPNPQPWYVTIPFSTPFFYDPSAGDLVVEVRRDSSPWDGGPRASDLAFTTATSTPHASTLYTTSPTSATGSSLFYGAGAVCGMTCAPVPGLYGAFRVSATTGATPLTVTFTQACYSTTPGAQLTWQWDLDGDGNLDSTLPNPSFTYTTCGNYTVQLTVQDGVHAPVVVTQTNLIRSDELQVDFSLTPLGNGLWQCTDLTTPAATGWAWDIDDDGIADSTLQNPTLQLGTTCSRALRLTATRACKTGTTARFVLQTPLQMVNDLAGGSAVLTAREVGAFFDVLVTAPEGVLVCGVSSATYETLGTNEVTMWTTPGSYLGKDGNSAQWRRVAHGVHTMNNSPYQNPTLATATFESPVYLPAGAHGIAIYHEAQSDYSSMVKGSSTGAIVGPDLTLHPSTGAPGLVRGRLFAGNVFPGRMSGILRYTKVTTTNQGGYGTFGLGCAGTLGVPGNRAVQQPRLGTTMNIEIDRLPLDTALFLLGSSRTASQFGPLPISLTPIGASNCDVRVSLDVSVVVSGSAQHALVPVAIPSTATLVGMQFFTQGLSLDFAANPLGLVASDAAALMIGL